MMLVPWTLAPFYLTYVVLFAVVALSYPGTFYGPTMKTHVFMGFCWLFLYLFGFVRQSWFSKFSIPKALLIYVTFPIVIYFAIAYEFVASCFSVSKTVWAIMTRKKGDTPGFHVVRKDLKSISDMKMPLLAAAA